MSTKEAVKIRNLQQNKTVYFSVDTDAMPNQGVKGRGTAIIVQDAKRAVPLSEKIVAKYLGDIHNSMAKDLIDQVKKGAEVLLEITPHFYSTWDYTMSTF